MSTPIHDQLKDFAAEVSRTSTKIARLELLIELIKYMQTRIEKTKSVRDQALLTDIIKHLQSLD